jgi:hypothetical protein
MDWVAGRETSGLMIAIYQFFPAGEVYSSVAGTNQDASPAGTGGVVGAFVS